MVKGANRIRKGFEGAYLHRSPSGPAEGSPRRPGADRTSARILPTPVRNRSGEAVGPAARGEGQPQVTNLSRQAKSIPQSPAVAVVLHAT
jgi:hypothetical protein